jgi:hypothetical protein
MKNGKWLAVREGVIDRIPSDRPASIGDFALIVTYLYRKETPTSILFLAERLCWSRWKVRSWLKKMGLEIEYIGKKEDNVGGVLKTIPKEILDPKTKKFWVVVFPTKRKNKNRHAADI